MSVRRRIINSFRSNPYQLFLLDGIGALISASLLLAILYLLPNFFSFSDSTILILSVVAYFFSIYSLVCSQTKPKKWSPFLVFIAISNLIYCAVTGLLVFTAWTQLAILEIIYFLIEIVIVSILVFLEIKVALAKGSISNEWGG